MQKRFETVIQIRPSDMDINFHVHYPKYLEYILFARFDQMERCYLFSMLKFMERGMGWVVKKTCLNFNSPVRFGDELRVVTWIEEMSGTDCQIAVEGKVKERMAVNGLVLFSLVNAKTGKSIAIPNDILEHFLSFKEA